MKDNDEVRDRHDMKLKEAERTIANKDVIIKMLQEQVKKLEETYKQNLKETEDFRYKFCLASEQMKRLIVSPNNKENEPRCYLARRKQSYEQSKNSTKCNYSQEIKNIENLMKAHHELLKTIVAKISDKEVSEPKKESEEIARLENEVERLKTENATLLTKLDLDSDSMLPRIKDSVLEAFKKSNIQLQRKVSTLLQKVSQSQEGFRLEDSSSEVSEDVYKRVSFSHQQTLLSTLKSVKSVTITSTHRPTEKKDQPPDALKAEDNASGHTDQSEELLHTKISDHDLEQETAEEHVKTCKDAEVQVTETNACRCVTDTKYQDWNIENENTSEQEDEQMGSTCYCTGELLCESEVIETDSNQDKNIEAFDQGDSNQVRMIESEEQGLDLEASNQIQNLELEVTKPANDLSQKLNEIRDRMSEFLEQQINTCKELELLKHEMSESRDSAQECIDNIAKLKQTIDEQNETFLAKFQEHKTVTDNLTQVNDKMQQELAELKNKIENLSLNVDELKNNRNPPSSPEIPPSLMYSEDLITIDQCKHGISLMSENKDTVKSLGIPTQYENQKAPDDLNNLEKENASLEKDNEDKDDKIDPINALFSYYKETNEVDDNLKNCKCGEGSLGTYVDKVQDENLKLKANISLVISHLNDKLSKLKSDRDQNQNSGDSCSCFDRGSRHSCVSCQKLEIEDIYNAVRRKFVRDCDNDSLSEQDFGSVQCRPRVTVSCSPICDKSAEHLDHCPVNKRSDDSLISNMENYVSYLHEQLNVITSIEQRIEDLRGHIKNP